MNGIFDCVGDSFCDQGLSVGAACSSTGMLESTVTRKTVQCAGLNPLDAPIINEVCKMPGDPGAC